MHFVRLTPLVASALAALVLAGPLSSLPASAATPGSTSAINTDADGLALAGYDAVAYFETNRPTHGMATITASYGGARYLFASEAHRKTFLANPQKYVPNIFAAKDGDYIKATQTVYFNSKYATYVELPVMK